MAEPEKGVLFDTIGKVVADVYSGVKGLAADQKAAVLNDASVGFRRLVLESYERWSKVKTVIDPDTAVPLKKIYVPARLLRSNKTITFDDFVEGLSTNNRAVVVGTAGAGKSLFLRAVLLHAVDYWPGPIPIYVELRRLNDAPRGEDALSRLIHETILNHVRGFDRGRLDHALYEGKFMLLLDALDEVDEEIRPAVVREIAKLSERNRKATIVLSTRPSEVLHWDDFNVFRMKGLSKSESAQLVQNLPYESIADLKARFLDEIIEKQFDRHEEFLSVPLLVVMMMLVYRSFAEVPDKIINFYKRAFETLFQGHDATKGDLPFKRKKQSGLALEDFTKVFSAFCVVSYAEGKTRFSQEIALEIARKAIELSEVEARAEDVVADLRQAVCVLQVDGTNLSFVHRSFQEYFAACYLVRCDWPEAQRLAFLRRTGGRLSRDNVSAMMRELDVGAFEKRWMLPAVVHLKEQIQSVATGLTGDARRSAIVSALLQKIDARYSKSGGVSSGTNTTELGSIWDFVSRSGAGYSSRIRTLFPSCLFEWLDDKDLAFALGVGVVDEVDSTEEEEEDEEDSREEWSLELEEASAEKREEFLGKSKFSAKIEREIPKLPKLEQELRTSITGREQRESDIFNW